MASVPATKATRETRVSAAPKDTSMILMKITSPVKVGSGLLSKGGCVFMEGEGVISILYNGHIIFLQ